MHADVHKTVVIEMSDLETGNLCIALGNALAFIQNRTKIWIRKLKISHRVTRVVSGTVMTQYPRNSPYNLHCFGGYFSWLNWLSWKCISL